MLNAQNPVIMDQFTADPTARVFDNRVYLYPSHDVYCNINWFCMKDYHVFSTENLVDWTDHGMIINQEDVEWVNAKTNSMWAPDCYEKNGKYYFYFPAIADTSKGLFGMRIGVAVSDNPYGPFTPDPMPIEGISGIDPNIFEDINGEVYIYWAGRGKLMGAKLKDNMRELQSEPVIIDTLPQGGGLKEGPFLFERKGVYYFTYPWVIDKTEALVYCMGDNPLGPFEYKGIIMDEHASGCWTNHHSVINFKGQWYLFYHNNDLSPDFDKNRSARADSLFFNADGTIQKVVPTLRGIGVTKATSKIQVDRYSYISSEGASVEFLDTTNTFDGWKTVLSEKGASISYNAVDFGNNKTKKVNMRVKAISNCIINLQTGGSNNELSIPLSNNWEVVQLKVNDIPKGIHNINLTLKTAGEIQIDWIQFE